jgi:hypothetical protein
LGFRVKENRGLRDYVDFTDRIFEFWNLGSLRAASSEQRAAILDIQQNSAVFHKDE